MVNPIPITNALKVLWIGTCNVLEYQDVKNPENHQTTSELVPIIENEPCRLSYSSEPVTDLNSGVVEVSQKIKLFIRPDLIIKPGSSLEITQHGRTNRYKRAGEPLVYTNHQEIVVELDKDA